MATCPKCNADKVFVCPECDDVERLKAAIEAHKEDRASEREELKQLRLQVSELQKEVERQKARVENEHEVAGELQEGLSKQYRAHCDELDVKDAEIAKWKSAAESFMKRADDAEDARQVANRLNSDLERRLKICADATDEFCNALEKADGKNPETIKAVAYWRQRFGEFKATLAERPVHEWVESAESGTVCKKCGLSYFVKDKPCEVKRNHEHAAAAFDAATAYSKTSAKCERCWDAGSVEDTGGLRAPCPDCRSK